MYVPRHFAEDRDEVVLALVRSAAFGHLVVATEEDLEATPIPFVVDEALTVVRAHVARPNPIWKLAPCNALMIVAVDDAYVSPTWYPSKAEHGKVVPTWNYQVVHLHGRLVAHDDVEWVGRQIRDLTDSNEATLPAPWAVSDAPEEYIATTQRGIVGLELDVTRIEAKRKLSQNRSADDITGVASGLRSVGGSAGIADAMELALAEVAEP
jgi:transcriptional regulator